MEPSSPTGATPTLVVRTTRSPPGRSKGSRRAWTTAWATASASLRQALPPGRPGPPGPSGPDDGSTGVRAERWTTTTNSSPPSRATVWLAGTAPRSRRPTCTSRASPTGCPWLSLMSLNRSRSMSSRAVTAPGASGRDVVSSRSTTTRLARPVRPSVWAIRSSWRTWRRRSVSSRQWAMANSGTPSWSSTTAVVTHAWTTVPSRRRYWRVYDVPRERPSAMARKRSPDIDCSAGGVQSASPIPSRSRALDQPSSRANASLARMRSPARAPRSQIIAMPCGAWSKTTRKWASPAWTARCAVSRSVTSWVAPRRPTTRPSSSRSGPVHDSR